MDQKLFCFKVKHNPGNDISNQNIKSEFFKELHFPPKKGEYIEYQGNIYVIEIIKNDIIYVLDHETVNRTTIIKKQSPICSECDNSGIKKIHGNYAVSTTSCPNGCESKNPLPEPPEPNCNLCHDTKVSEGGQPCTCTE